MQVFLVELVARSHMSADPHSFKTISPLHTYLPQVPSLLVPTSKF
jgi:hypothetical protein